MRKAAQAAVGAEQLWFDVDRPIQTPPRRAAGPGRSHPQPSNADRQMELRMVPRPAAPPVVAAAPPEPPAAPVTPIETPDPAPPRSEERRSFGAWLLDQVNRRGTLGELAKAARQDRAFPRKGSVDDVRARFSSAGADGDAFEALDDAEREYERDMP